jgi:hypothetical protein
MCVRELAHLCLCVERTIVCVYVLVIVIVCVHYLCARAQTVPKLTVLSIKQ